MVTNCSHIRYVSSYGLNLLHKNITNRTFNLQTYRLTGMYMGGDYVIHNYTIYGAAVAQGIALAAHGQWVVGSYPIKVIGGVRKGIRPQFLLCAPKTNQSQDPHRKKANYRVSHRVWRLYTGVSFLLLILYNCVITCWNPQRFKSLSALNLLTYFNTIDIGDSFGYRYLVVQVRLSHDSKHTTFINFLHCLSCRQNHQHEEQHQSFPWQLRVEGVVATEHSPSLDPQRQQS